MRRRWLGLVDSLAISGFVGRRDDGMIHRDEVAIGNTVKEV